MKRLGILGLAVSLTLGGCAAAPDEGAEIALAREIHERVLTLDTHVDIPFNYATDEVDPWVRGRFQVDLPKMREGALDAAFFIVYVGQGLREVEGNARAYDQAMTKFNAIRGMTCDLYPEEDEL